jgi:glycosyltransferase involved in cell wall biosynthesis
MTQIFINGRFLSQPFTGVQRYGTEVVKALDMVLRNKFGKTKEMEFFLLLPPDAIDTLPLEYIHTRRIGKLRGIFWEQFELGNAAASGVLLNLGSTGSLFHSKQIITIHDANVYRIPGNFSFTFRTWYKFLMPLLGRRAKNILTVSKFSKQELADCCNIPENKITVVHNSASHILSNPADNSIFESLNLESSEYVLCIGSGRPNKNTDLVQKAIVLLDGLGLQLVLVGTVDRKVFDHSEIEQRSNVHEVGAITDQQMRALFERAFCFVFPSLYEGFGIPPLEAMACGCPVIVSNIPALVETCGDAAIYCDTHDADDLAGKIRTLHTNLQLRERMVVAGIARANAFSWERCATIILNQIDKITDQK